MSKNLVRLLLVTYCLSLIALSPNTVLAQESSFGVAMQVPVTDENAKDGSILSNTTGKYSASTVEYDPMVIGVVTENPAVVFNIQDLEAKPIIRSGNVLVNVSTINGAIKAGDMLTTSTIPGAAMKATKSGYVIGVAMEPYEVTDTKDIGQISVAINIHYYYTESPVVTGLFDVASILTPLSTFDRPSVVIKYFIAGFILLFSVVLGFISFARVAANGVEAIGRNPLAGHMIQVGIFLNALVTIVITLSGLALAYFVLRL